MTWKGSWLMCPPIPLGHPISENRKGSPTPTATILSFLPIPLFPITRTEKYYTSFPFQKEVHIDIYQGEDPDALKNIPVGNFRVKGLATGSEPNTVLCKMSLDIDGNT